ncbi:uncharacterized protein V1518DRAFT_413573 [Limtongia smithiae]|uniref:uncharacterized protein n=1 Tax=Limtongia smithiae TaxID=1125753 RepID=UPI0034CE5B17
MAPRAVTLHRAILVVLVALAAVVSLLYLFSGTLGPDAGAISGPDIVVDDDDVVDSAAGGGGSSSSLPENYQRLEGQYWRNAELRRNPSPLSVLAYCGHNLAKNPERSNYLVSVNSKEGTMARMRFPVEGPDPAYNPNLLPYPIGSPHPYIGFARVTPKEGEIGHHELVYCDMEWSSTPVIKRRILTCASGKAAAVPLPEWESPEGFCSEELSFLTLKNGHTDPRIFFSTRGEPLMIIGTNGIHNCLHQYIIDLRAVVPGLSTKMNLDSLPVRFAQLTELNRREINEIEKNWFILYDPNGREYVHHDIANRSLSVFDNPHIAGTEVRNIANPTPSEVLSLLKDYSNDENSANHMHQATNSLRVTLCDFPCIPTIHNTVLIEIIHVKYKNIFEIFYRRYVIVMNATAPFDIIGRTPNLMYAGTDEQTMIYTVSMAWDHNHYRRHVPWDEEKYGGQDVWKSLRDKEAAEQKAQADRAAAVAVAKAKAAGGKRSFSGELISREAASKTDVEMKRLKQNPLVNQYYQGWLNDVVMINIGINDQDSAVIHTTARHLLSCIHVVPPSS